MQNNIQPLLSSFEQIKQEKDWVECWSARDLQKVLGYAKWRNFYGIIKKSIISCQEAGNDDKKHFAKINKPLKWWYWAVQYVDDYLIFCCIFTKYR